MNDHVNSVIAIRTAAWRPSLHQIVEWFPATPLNQHLSGAILLPLLLLFASSPVLAERADREKPVHIEADQVLVDDAQQVSTFTGNVQMTQGTLIIRGNRIVVTQDGEGFKHGTAYGNLASFRQKREGLDEYVEGYGERIEYDTRAETADFYVRARVKRNLDEVRGEHITYDQKTDVFKVHGKPAGNTPPKRVRAVLQPKPKADQPKPAPNPALPIAPSTTLTPEEN